MAKYFCIKPCFWRSRLWRPDMEVELSNESFPRECFAQRPLPKPEQEPETLENLGKNKSFNFVELMKFQKRRPAAEPAEEPAKDRPAPASRR